MKRSRGRNRRSGGNNNNNHNNPNRHYESVGPDVKIRGSAQQVLDKYLQYARDAQTSGDRVTSEAYYQFAEHYQRIVAKQTEAKDKQRKEREEKDAQRREERQKSSDNKSDNKSDNNSDQKSGQDQDASKSDDGEKKPRGRRKKRDDDRSDAAQASEEKSDAPSEEEKPKKRRTYRKKSEETAAAADADETDGVMKTLSRGRKKPASDDKASTSDGDGDVATEAAE